MRLAQLLQLQWDTIKSMIKSMITSLMKWIAAGAIGGWLCAFIIFSIAGLIGKSGSSGTEYLGYWSPAYIGLSIFYGIPAGVISLAVCRVVFFWINDAVLFHNSWILILATVIGGVIGCLNGFFTAAIFAIVFFVCALTWFSIAK
jgi:hypothetical protein